MNHLKTFENLSMMSFTEEIKQIKYMINFCEIHNIDEFVSSYKNKKMHLVYDFFREDDDEKWIWKLENNEKVDIMVGIPRNQAIQVYDKIINDLDNLTPEQIETLQAKTLAKKYNL